MFVRVGVAVGDDPLIAAAALTRPQPLRLSNPAAPISVAVDSIRVTICALSVMPAAISSAATPATCGDANDVPLPMPYVPVLPLHVQSGPKTPSPGAITSSSGP